jgi:hypothetical protein
VQGSFAFTLIVYVVLTASWLQVALQLFWLLSFCPEPLSMSAQSLIARDSADRQRITIMCWLLLRLAGFLSIGLAALVATCFLFGSYLFTVDDEIIAGVHELVLPVRYDCDFCQL